jgi:uncharacterized damage-inducible protein DinB
MKNPYVAFASNNAWANRTLYDAVAGLSARPRSQPKRPGSSPRSRPR